MKRYTSRGFTIVELLVVVSIIALLIGILLPAIGKARDKARTTTSVSNLRQLAIAHNAYAADWEDAQMSLARYNISAYGSWDAYNEAIGYLGADEDRITGHPPQVAGWGVHQDTGEHRPYSWWPSDPDHHFALEPIGFPGAHGITGYGWFRYPNVKTLTTYLNSRYYDKLFYAPKDPNWEAIQKCIDNPNEFANIPGCNPPIETTYCLSPASLFSPDVLSLNNETNEYYTDPWELPGGHRTPTMGSIRYPTVKTHMLEHPWLQNVRRVCNPAFSSPSPYDAGCEPYYFNHGFESTPATLFYDGHVRLMGTQEALNANRRHLGQTGIGLWSIDTPFEGGYEPSAPGGYFMDFAYDFTATSYHILTIDGALGRDTLGSAQ